MGLLDIIRSLCLNWIREGIIHTELRLVQHSESESFIRSTVTTLEYRLLQWVLDHCHLILQFPHFKMVSLCTFKFTQVN